MGELEEALGYRFHDTALLREALTHRSLVAESEGEVSNERLEFLGDAVLGLVIAEALFAAGDLDEGDMAKARSGVVDERALSVVARRIDLGPHVRLGKGEVASGGADKASILADTLEAVIGAVFQDGGYEETERLILELWEDMLAERVAAPGRRDYKTRLQEALARHGATPEYEVEGTGPDHARDFTARVLVGGRSLGTGGGSSKKRAEQEAARQALADLDEPDA